MAIAFDAVSNPTPSANDPLSWTHTPAGTPKGVFVAVGAIQEVDTVVGVTYGGVSLTEISDSPQLLAMPGGANDAEVHIFFLGSNVPTGAQTVSIDMSSAVNHYAACVTVTAPGNLAIEDTNFVNDDSSATATVNLTTTRTTFVLGALLSGLGVATQVGPGADYTQRYEVDTGDSTFHVQTRTTNPSAGTVTVNWSVSGTDTVVLIAVAIYESGAVITPSTGSLATAFFVPTIFVEPAGIIPITKNLVTTMFAPDATLAAGRAVPLVDTLGPYEANLVIEVFEGANGFETTAGFFNRILRAKIHEEINKVYSFEFVIALTDPNYSLLETFRIVFFHLRGIGQPIFKGIIESIEISMLDDRPVAVVTGSSMATELANHNVFRSRIYEDVTPATIISDLLDFIPTVGFQLSSRGWVGTLTGSGYTNITKEFKNDTVWQVLETISEIEHAYIRDLCKYGISEFRQFEIKNTHATFTSHVLKNFEEITPDLLENTNLGIISALRSHHKDARSVRNVIVPVAKVDGQEVFDLRFSNRSSPYLIDYFVTGRPAVSSIEYVEGTTDSANVLFDAREGQSIEIECQGDDRAILFFLLAEGTLANGNSVMSDFILVNGVRATAAFRLMLGDLTAGTNRHIGVMMWPYTRPGVNNIEWKFTAGTSVPYTAVAIALQNSDRIIGPRGGTHGAEESGSGVLTPDLTSIPSSAFDAIIDVLLTINDVTGIVDAGQVELLDDQRAHISYKKATSSNEEVGWTLSGSPGDYYYVAWSIMSARNYFIFDEDSVDAYGARHLVLNAGDFPPTTNDLEEASNILYDYAVDYMEMVKDPIEEFKFELLTFPDVDHYVGDIFPIEYNTPEIAINRDDLVLIAKDTMFNEDGIPRYEITVAERKRFAGNIESLILSIEERIKRIQDHQV